MDHALTTVPVHPYREPFHDEPRLTWRDRPSWWFGAATLASLGGSVVQLLLALHDGVTWDALPHVFCCLVLVATALIYRALRRHFLRRGR